MVRIGERGWNISSIPQRAGETAVSRISRKRVASMDARAERDMEEMNIPRASEKKRGVDGDESHATKFGGGNAAHKQRDGQHGTTAIMP